MTTLRSIGPIQDPPKKTKKGSSACLLIVLGVIAIPILVGAVSIGRRNIQGRQEEKEWIASLGNILTLCDDFPKTATGRWEEIGQPERLVFMRLQNEPYRDKDDDNVYEVSFYLPGDLEETRMAYSADEVDAVACMYDTSEIIETCEYGFLRGRVHYRVKDKVIVYVVNPETGELIDQFQLMTEEPEKQCPTTTRRNNVIYSEGWIDNGKVLQAIDDAAAEALSTTDK